MICVTEPVTRENSVAKVLNTKRGFMMKRLILAGAAAAALSFSANAATIDFNGETSNNVASLTIGSVTFTAPGGTVYTNGFGNTPNGTVGLIGYNGSTFPTLRADIAGGTNFVSIDLGDFNADADALFLNVFDAANVLLGSDAINIPGSFVGLMTLSVNAPGIAYATFGGVGVAGSSVYADNFTFDGPGGGIPEPATWALMVFGFGITGAAMRSRRRAVALA